ncbi:hypothetical protein ANCCAN_25277 [Ancylostoma caninum]|uniref:Serum response factor-binding protein 1 n=1 Tax=Ancylostoma caninum TaxID=29170 RepID=A0A368F9X3_ANCCA|nr:hypothetical protein ANCCAN_25277 [Ancylostoma caninum]
MPNLTPLDGSKKKASKKTKVPEKTEKTTSSSEGTTLTSEQLNIEIVRLRSVVQKAQRFLIQRLVRKIKRMETILAKKENNALKRKVQRYEEEIHFLKTIKKDDVSKFALLNKKSLDELRITDKTPVRERSLYKLACETPVIKAVQQYRNRYPSWEVTTAYLLQRLGAQYSSTKEIALDSMPSDSEGSESSEEALQTPKKKSKIAKSLPNKASGEHPKAKKVSSVPQRSMEESMSDQNDAGLSSEDESDGNSDGSGDDEPDVEIGSESDDNEETAAHRRDLLLGPASSARISKKKKPSPLKKKVHAVNSEISESKSPSKVQSSTSSVRTAPKKKKKTVLRGGKARELTSNANESVATSTAVVKKVKLSEVGEIKLSKRPVLAEDRPHQSIASNSNSESHSFFLPSASASTTLKLSADPSRSDRNDHTTSSKKPGVPPPVKRAKLRMSKGITADKKVAVAQSKKVKSKESAASMTTALSNSEELHPSWAARRQAKERQLSAPQSKRIVFDED